MLSVTLAPQSIRKIIIVVHNPGLAQDRDGRSRHIPKKATVRENRRLD